VFCRILKTPIGSKNGTFMHHIILKVLTSYCCHFE
jgi:hypothetical protein